MEHVDAPGAAGKLNEMKKQIGAVRKSLESANAKPAKAQVTAAVEATTRLHMHPHPELRLYELDDAVRRASLPRPAMLPEDPSVVHVGQDDARARVLRTLADVGELADQGPRLAQLERGTVVSLAPVVNSHTLGAGVRFTF